MVSSKVYGLALKLSDIYNVLNSSPPSLNPAASLFYLPMNFNSNGLVIR
jgi:hypothetical protein